MFTSATPCVLIVRYWTISGDPSLPSATTGFGENPSCQHGRSPYDSDQKYVIITLGTNCFKHGVVKGQSSCVHAMNEYVNSRRQTSDPGRKSENEMSGRNNLSNSKIIVYYGNCNCIP